MPVLNFSNKDPDDDLPFRFEWDQHFPTGDVIVNAVWTVPSGLTSHGPAVDGTNTLIWLSGGTAGQSYVFTCQATSNAGWVSSQSGRVRISDTQ